MKIKYLLLFLCLCLLVSCKNKKTKDLLIIEQYIEQFELPSEITDDITLKTTDDNIKISWNSLNKTLLSDTGKVKQQASDEIVTIIGTFTLNDISKEKNFTIKIKAFTGSNDENVLNTFVDAFVLPNEIENDLELIEFKDNITITWTSSRQDILSNKGIINPIINDQEIILLGTFTLGKITKNKSFTIIVKGKAPLPTEYELLEKFVNEYILLSETSIDLVLETLNDDIIITWISNKPEILTNDGKINPTTVDNEVVLKGTFNKNNNIIEKCFTIIVKAKIIEEQTDLDILTNFVNEFKLPQETSENLILSKVIDQYTITWETSNRDIITTTGIIKRTNKDRTVILTGYFKYHEEQLSKSFSIKVLSYTPDELLLQAIDEIELPTTTNKNLELPIYFANGIIGSWESNKPNIISSEGIYNPDQNDVEVKLTITLTYQEVNKEASYIVIATGYPNLQRLNDCLNKIEIPTILLTDLNLPKDYENGIIASWLSSNQDILTNDGIYNVTEETITITLKLILELGSDSIEKEFIMKTAIKPEPILEKEHQIIVRAEAFNSTDLIDLKQVGQKIVISEGKTSGSYESPIISTKGWTSLVGSWAATSSKNATVELQVKARVDGVWSNYISYSAWGLGLENKGIDQNPGIIKLVDDEVMTINSKIADAIRYKITLRRTTSEIESPKLSLVSFALKIDNYLYAINEDLLPKAVNYIVPKLYQGAVPTIGGEICSATSTTMLLKYQGLDFSSYDTYEHRYVAYLVRDYGNNIFGNWVYNTVTIGAFGYNSYVARMYSLEELMYHLAFVGPVAISVKGQMTSNLKNYYTNGHLLVITGYRYDGNKLIFLANDPNVSNVACEYDSSIIKTTWRNIVYVVE